MVDGLHNYTISWRRINIQTIMNWRTIIKLKISPTRRSVRDFDSASSDLCSRNVTHQAGQVLICNRSLFRRMFQLTVTGKCSIVHIYSEIGGTMKRFFASMYSFGDIWILTSLLLSWITLLFYFYSHQPRNSYVGTYTWSSCFMRHSENGYG